MKTLSLACFFALSLPSSGSFAQATTPVPEPAAQAVAPMIKEMAEAEVRKVDKEAKKVTLKHGPIKNLDMPSMTMVFQVRDEKLFDKLVSGEKIKFTAEQLQGAFVVTGVEKAEAQ
jgi:Cu(I)/Ag(I) efflux system periplasmic protein CusF